MHQLFIDNITFNLFLIVTYVFYCIIMNIFLFDYMCDSALSKISEFSGLAHTCGSTYNFFAIITNISILKQIIIYFWKIKWSHVNIFLKKKTKKQLVIENSSLKTIVFQTTSNTLIKHMYANIKVSQIEIRNCWVIYKVPLKISQH